MKKQLIYILSALFAIPLNSEVIEKKAVVGKIAYYDIYEIMAKSEIALDIQKQLKEEQIYKKFPELKAKEQRLEQLQKELTSTKNMVKPDANAKKEEEARKIYMEINKIQQDNPDFFSMLMQVIQQQVAPFLFESKHEIRVKQGWDAIIRMEDPDMSDRLNVTKDIIDQMNENYRAIKEAAKKQEESSKQEAPQALE